MATLNGGRTRKRAATALRRSIREVHQSKAYRNAASRARAYAKDPKRLRELFEQASRRSKGAARGPFQETWAYLMAMIRLIRAYANGTYREVPWNSLVIITGAVIYFVSPVDVIADWLPGAGFIDDAFVVALALRTVKDDLDTFMFWEADRDPNA